MHPNNASKSKNTKNPLILLNFEYKNEYVPGTSRHQTVKIEHKLGIQDVSLSIRKTHLNSASKSKNPPILLNFEYKNEHVPDTSRHQRQYKQFLWN